MPTSLTPTGNCGDIGRIAANGKTALEKFVRHVGGITQGHRSRRQACGHGTLINLHVGAMNVSLGTIITIAPAKRRPHKKTKVKVG